MSVLPNNSLTGQEGFDWFISQTILLVNDRLTSHKFSALDWPSLVWLKKFGCLVAIFVAVTLQILCSHLEITKESEK